MKNIILSCFLVLVTDAFVLASPIVEIKTTKGTMQIELYPKRATKTVENFLRYVESGYYNQLIFHRVISGWIIQSGGYDKDFLVEDTFAPIRNEATNGLKNTRGTIAMARLRDPHTADSQFFINLKNNKSFNHRARTFNDYGYAVFGKVVSGLEVADAIGDVETHEVDGYADVPVEPVIITSIKLLSDE